MLRNLKTVNRTLSVIEKSLKCGSACARNLNAWTQDRIIKSPYANIEIPNCTLYDYVWQNLDKWPERTASVCATTGRGYTYEQAFKLSNTFAANLRTKLKLKDGDIVAVMLPNIPDFPLVALGIMEAGGVVSTINPVYTAHEVHLQLVVCDVKLVVTLTETVSVVKEALKLAKLNIPIIAVRTEGKTVPKGTILFNELTEDVHVDKSCLKQVRRSINDICFLPYSSGTTGLPKGVELSSRNIIANCEQINEPLIRTHNETTVFRVSNDRDPTKLLNDLVELVESVARRIILPTAQIDVLTATNLESYLDPSPYMGYGFELKLTEYELLPEAERNLRHRCKQFTLKLIQEMRSRLPTNITILRTMSMLSVQETLKAIKPPIIKLAQEFGCQANEIERIVVQWRNIRHTDWENKCSTVEFWSEVYGYKDSADNNPFSELASLAISILSLPHSNAEIERVFSQMNIVKTKLRNRMSLHTLNSILHIRYGLKRSGKCCHSYNVPENVLKQIRGIKESLVMPMTIAIEDGPSTSQAQAHDEADIDDLQILFDLYL